MKTQILKDLILHGKTVAPTIAERLSISIPTINKYLHELIDEGLVLTFGKDGSSRGRKPVIYSVNPDACYFCGVDINQHSLEIMLVNMEGEEVRGESVADSFIFDNTPIVLADICKRVKAFLDSDEATSQKVRMVSFNISGRVNSETGYSYSIFNFEGNDRPLSQTLAELIGYPVTIDNNTRSMTYGEILAGSMKGHKDGLFINFSWGLGLGILIDGRLYTGMKGYAGELGHIHKFDNNIMCHCGRVGCLETEVSISAIARHIDEEIQRGRPSIIYQIVQAKGLSAISTSCINEALDREDPLTMDVVETAARLLGENLANLINVFNPEIVVIGGTQSLHMAFFLDAVKQAVTRYSLKLLYKDIVIEPSTLKGKGGVIGAALNARKVYFTKMQL
ncbi:MAG: ROK family transcriptional regulator [Bacteroidales bacterium]|nr:ROK family transcriptional regulator [Bacteroidales bacterium]